MKLNDRIVLRTFGGVKCADEVTQRRENYWMLIGKCGVIIELDRVSAKALILFDDCLDTMELINHNRIKNTLWLSLSDMEVM